MWINFAHADLMSIRENVCCRKCQSKVVWRDLIAAVCTLHWLASVSVMLTLSEVKHATENSSLCSSVYSDS